MASIKQITTACRRLAAAATALVAVHTLLALHTPAQAQTIAPAGAPALFVAPQLITVAAPAGAPSAVPALAHPAPADETKHASVPPAAAAAPANSIACNTLFEFSRFDRPLLRTMRRLSSGKPLTIVAIGSSSTAGAGASSPDASYPSRLAAELRQRFPGHDITVLNRGINGEETSNMMARFPADVIAVHPQLVLWQVGTNSVLRDRPLDRHEAELHDGIDQLKAADADVVLIDPQFSPAVVAKPETDGMVAQIALAAKNENVDLFRRFAVMRDWHDAQHLSFDKFVAPDRLHMNDWSYACMAKLLGGAIAEAASRPIASAAAHSAH
jgi:lysophospholipase L1-like esterase